MKKIVLILALLLATSSLAVIDPDPDHMGLYFDLNADSDSMELSSFQPFYLYLILTNPTFSDVYGFEAGLTMEGPIVLAEVTFDNPEAINSGSETSLIVDFGTPTPTVPATLLATWYIYYTGAGESAYMWVHGIDSEAELPEVNVGEGQMMALEVTQYGGYQADINTAVSPVEGMSFDRIKSLYR